MRNYSPLLGIILCLAIVQGTVGFFTSSARAQSQEPKPARESATPPMAEATPVGPMVTTGLGDASWHSPIWGIQIRWKPDYWRVENELIDTAYEGLQLGSDASTVYIEAYEGLTGSAEDCLTAAEQEIAERPNTREVTRLANRPLPEVPGELAASHLFGVVAELPDGTIYRGAEYIMCRSLEPDGILEVTWQTATTSYNDELPRVSEVLASLIVADDADT